MANSDPLTLGNQYCHVIYSASNAITRYYKPVLKPLGITYPQYLIMMVLWEADGVNINTISKATFFDSGTLTPLLNKLREKNFISVESDPKDLRHKIVRLTKVGKMLKVKAAAIPETLGCLLAIKMKDLDAMKAVVQTFHQALLNFEASSHTKP